MIQITKQKSSLDDGQKYNRTNYMKANVKVSLSINIFDYLL